MANRDDPETCDDCGAIVGGNPDCGACRDWVYRDARRPTSFENDERDPTVPSGTSPLPYVEVGMRVVHPDDGAKWWEVESIHADDSLGMRDHTICALRSNDARRLSDVPCELVRQWRLAEDFDPDEPREAVPAYARDTEGEIRERFTNREYPRSVEEDIAYLLGELDSARLGCEIAYRREPTREEMRAALAASRDGEAFIAMGGWTARTCRVCGEPVAGGPTACAVCAERETIADLRAKLARAEADRCPQMEDFGPGPERMCSACCVVLDKPHTWEECAFGQREAWVTEHAARVLAEKRLAGARAATKLREAFARDIAEIKRDRDAATVRAERAEAEPAHALSAEARALVERATPQPWAKACHGQEAGGATWWSVNRAHDDGRTIVVNQGRQVCRVMSSVRGADDAALIARAPALLLELAAALDAAKATQDRAKADAAGPPLEAVPEDPAGERGDAICSNCGCPLDEPHTWRECAEWLRKSRDVCLFAAHKAIADIQRELGADEEDANANYTDAIDLAREVSGKVDDLERALRVSTERRDAATARAERAEAEPAHALSAEARALVERATPQPWAKACHGQEAGGATWWSVNRAHDDGRTIVVNQGRQVCRVMSSVRGADDAALIARAPALLLELAAALDAAKATQDRAKADAAAMRARLQRQLDPRRLDCSCDECELARDVLASSTAGAALLREVEAGRALAEAVRADRSDLNRPVSWAAMKALVAYDEARGAR